MSLFKKYSPVKHSIYGNRFLTGRKENSAGVPIIITNGLGTSRMNVRLFTPSEVVLVVLHRVEKNNLKKRLSVQRLEECLRLIVKEHKIKCEHKHKVERGKRQISMLYCILN